MFVILKIMIIVLVVVILVIGLVIIVYVMENEKCFGVLLVGENDCVVGLGIICVGLLIVDYQGNVWILVLVGICELIELFVMVDGLVCMGLLEVLECDLLNV